MEFLYEYGMFFAKAITVVLAIIAVVIIVLASAVKQKGGKGELRLTNISEELEELQHDLKEELYT
ncbi:MAG: serine protease SohB, partial [Shewanella sp.]